MLPRWRINFLNRRLLAQCQFPVFPAIIGNVIAVSVSELATARLAIFPK
jgi:hypothetical protein